MAEEKTEKKKRSAERHYGREVTALLLFGLALFFALAIFSYHPGDPTFFNATPWVHNWCGLTGAFLAYLFRAGFGLAAYLLPATFLCLAALAWFERKLGLSLARSAAALAFLLGSAALLSLSGSFGPAAQDAGGAVGAFLGLRMQLLAGRGGGVVLLLCFLAVSFIFATRISLASLAAWGLPLLWRATAALLAGLGKSGLWLRQKVEALYRALGLDQRTLAEGFEEIQQQGEHLIKTKKPRCKPKAESPEADAAPEAAPAVPPLKKRGKYQLPPLSLLNDPPAGEVEVNQQELLENAKLLENKLKDFGIFGRVAEIHPGPVITMYEFEPAPGIKVNRIVALSDDLAMAMRAVSVRIVAPIPGKAAVGIEIPNKIRQTVYLKEILTSDDFNSGHSLLHLCLGKDIAGAAVITDLKKMPHLLVAGATGSGKSVAVNSMITSILYRATPDQVKFIMVDPKLLELSLYDHIPHLLLPVVTNPRKAAAALRWSVLEMERRYRLLADLGVRDIDSYNKKVPPLPAEKPAAEKKEAAAEAASAPAVLAVPPAAPPEKEEHKGALPHIVIVIDELADLMMVSTKEVEDSLTRLAQMARAAGLHLILATQRPSVDVITGIIKANFSTRISFQVSSRVDSRTVLDTIGAERLLGRGDMLFLPPGTSKLQRIHGCFVSDGEIRKVCEFLRQQETPIYDEEILRVQELKQNEEEPDEEDEMYDRALAIVSESRIASISMIQRKLRIGYNRAARMIERMEKEGVVSRGDPGKPREVLLRHPDYE